MKMMAFVVMGSPLGNNAGKDKPILDDNIITSCLRLSYLLRGHARLR